jgi:hypothetical protein
LGDAQEALLPRDSHHAAAVITHAHMHPKPRGCPSSRKHTPATFYGLMFITCRQLAGPLALPCLHKITLSLSLTLTPLSHSLSHSHSHLSPTYKSPSSSMYTQPHKHTLSHTHIHSLTHTHTHTCRQLASHPAHPHPRLAPRASPLLQPEVR